jgi:hypothetical protein
MLYSSLRSESRTNGRSSRIGRYTLGQFSAALPRMSVALVHVVVKSQPISRKATYTLTAGTNLFRSRDSSLGIATDYGLDDRGVRVRVPWGSRILFSLHVVQSCSKDEVIPALCDSDLYILTDVIASLLAAISTLPLYHVCSISVWFCCM